MLVLSKGFKKPQAGDKGSVFFPALEFDIQQLNDHTHDGVDSQRITAKSVTGVAQTITAAGWVATSGGTYRQLVTMPAGMNYDDFNISVRLSATGHIIYPTIEKNAATSFYIYINDNTLDLRVVYC